jgi:hypothetical protein
MESAMTREQHFECPLKPEQGMRAVSNPDCGTAKVTGLLDEEEASALQHSSCLEKGTSASDNSNPALLSRQQAHKLIK